MAGALYTALVAGLLAARALEAPLRFKELLFAGAGITFLVLFAWGFWLSSCVDLPQRKLLWMKVHMTAHLCPGVYVAVLYFEGPPLEWTLHFVAPMLAFFLTGREFWRWLHEVFGARMYWLFFKGNTGLLVSNLLLLAVGFLGREPIGLALYHRVLTAYFIVHFLLTGIAISKISSDFVPCIRA